MHIDVVIFDPKYWIFSLGISLNRYEEQDQTETWVRKELDLGFLAFSIRFSIIRDVRKKEG